MHQYFAIITLALGNAQSTTSMTINSESPVTRENVWKHMRQHMADVQHDDRWLSAATLFFTAEPNTLG
jgi:hypothetical protein